MVHMNTRTVRGDHRIIALSRKLAEDADTVATAVAWARHLAAEPHIWPTTTLGDGGSRSTTVSSQPERHMLIQAHHAQQETDLIEHIRALQGCHRDLMDLCHTILRTRDDKPQERPVCKADATLAGYLEWVDPLCTDLARSQSGGLCNRCRVRAERWRRAHNLTPLLDERRIDHDSDTYVGDDGVAHTRPIRGAA